jgi:hypothetical protein
VAGFRDGSLWEKAKRKGDAQIKKMIDDGLHRTSVTCVLIGQRTHEREYVEYEIERSRERGNGLLGIYIHDIKDQNGETDFMAGKTPSALRKAGAKVYNWSPEIFSEWIESAYQQPRQRNTNEVDVLTRFFRWLNA